MTEKINKIKAARAKAGISQQKLSERLGIPKRTIENWESEVNSPPEWAEKLLIQAIENLSTSLIIRQRHNADFDVKEYNCGSGWRTTLLGAMEEAGQQIEMTTLSKFLGSVAIHRGLDEYEAERIAKEVEAFFGVLVVPKDLNPSHHR